MSIMYLWMDRMCILYEYVGMNTLNVYWIYLWMVMYVYVFIDILILSIYKYVNKTAFTYHWSDQHCIHHWSDRPS